MKNTILSLMISVLIIPTISLAHPGRTDSSGCHTCRTNCSNWGLSTGEYHCHNAKALPQPKEPIKSTYGEQGTGYTTPAPEYKIPKTTTTHTPETIKKIDLVAPRSETPVKSIVIPEPVVEKKSWISRLFGWLF